MRMPLAYILKLSLSIIFFGTQLASGQSKTGGSLSGQLKLDSSWSSTLYLSHIPSFDDRYVMSNEMIISNTNIDNLGYFSFDISFLPEEENLFRLHLCKKGDSPASLIIGGKEENHLFLIASRYASIQLEANTSLPPFKHAKFINSGLNTSFQRITDLVNRADSIISESGAAKRKFIVNKLQKELRSIADSANDPLISLYAVYQSKYETNYTDHIDFYSSYIEKWENNDSNYFKSFKKQLIIPSTNYFPIIQILFALSLIALGFFIGRHGKRKKKKEIEKLSVQERKIFELLKQGATNQEISNQYHIEISTAKSHVSNILSKLNVKSRKDIMNI